MHNLDAREIRKFHNLSQKLLRELAKLFNETGIRSELTWKVAVIMACEATIAARTATMSEKINHPCGTAL